MDDVRTSGSPTVCFKHGRGGYANHGCRCDVCKAGMADYQKRWRAANLETIKEKDRKRNAARSDEMKEYLRGYYLKNKKRMSENTKEWVRNNRKRLNVAKRVYDKNRCDLYPSYKIAKRLRSRMGKALRGNAVKCSHTFELIGCSPEELRKHLQSRFLDGMTWSNYGEWHVDHIRPCASFDLTDPEQQRICFNWKNLQPLWAKENMSKNNRWAA